MKRAWIKKDIANIERVRRLTDAPEISYADLEALAPDDEDPFGNDASGPVPLGFGAHHFHFPLFGGYTTITVTSLLHREAVGALTIVGPTLSIQHPPLEKKLKKAWGDNVTYHPAYTGDEARFEYRDDTVLARLDAERAAELGPMSPPPQSHELRWAFDTLAAPLSRGIIGDCVGYGATVPDETKAIDALVAKGAYDIVRAVLRSANPEGRFLAASLLEAHPEQHRDNDAEVIRRIFELDIPLWFGDGCTVFTQTAREFLSNSTADARTIELDD